MIKRHPIFRLVRPLIPAVLWLLLIILSLRSVTAQPGSRPGKAARPATDTCTIIAMVQQATEVRDTNPGLGHELLQAALAGSQALKYDRGLFLTYNWLATYAQINGAHDTAIRYLLLAAQYANTPMRARSLNIIYNNIGLSYSALGKYEQALEYYNQALAVLGKNKQRYNNTDSSGVYSNIGILWARMEENTHALQMFRKAEEIATRMQDTIELVQAWQNLGEIYYNQHQWDSAKLYFRKAIDATLLSGHGDPAGMLASLALVYNKQNDRAQAFRYLDQAMKLIEEYHMPVYTQLGVRAALGEVYFDMKAYDKALPILAAAFAAAKAIGHRERLQGLEPQLATAYAATGRYREAYEHALHYAVTKDSLFRQEKTRSLEVWMNARMAGQDKAMLAQQLRIARQQSQLARKNFWIGGTILGALLLLAIIIALLRNNRQRQALQQVQLRELEQKQEIGQLKAQVRGEEQERQRIAHELHDGIASQLWAIRLNVEQLQQAGQNETSQNEQLSAVYRQLSDAAQDVRRTAHNLLPDLLLEEGLATALASLCAKTHHSTRLEVDFQEYGIVPRLDQEIELSLYRMVQELVQNVLKHARNATHLLVQLSCADALLNITVEDNGTAFLERAQEAGIGLQQIRRRTQALKGHFDLQSIPGKGTTAYLEFDLQHLL